MNGVDFIVDTNIPIYVLEENPVVRGIMQCSVAVSVITEIELLGKKGISTAEVKIIRALLDDCLILGLTDEVKDITIDLKQRYGIAVPDAIIAATALHFGLTLITADKGFRRLQDCINVVILDM